MSDKGCEQSSPVVRPAIEVADIFREHGQDYLNNHSASPEQVGVINQIISYRTAAQVVISISVIIAGIPKMLTIHAETVTALNARPWQKRSG